MFKNGILYKTDSAISSSDKQTTSFFTKQANYPGQIIPSASPEQWIQTESKQTKRPK